MSQLLGPINGAGGGQANSVIWPLPNDDSIQPPWYRTTKPQTYEGITEYSDILWTRSDFPGAGNQSASMNCCMQWLNQYWEWNWPWTGNHSRKKVIGIVRNSIGNPVAGATVWLFNTLSGVLVDTQTSGPDGSYNCGDPNAVACIAVGYLTNSPDTSGTTADTVTGV